MNVAFIVPYPGKQHYQKDYDQIFQAIEAAGGTVLGPENTKDKLYQAVLKQEGHIHDKSRAHYEFLRKSILDSDAVVVETSFEDFRMGHEATLALLYHKPVLVLSQHLNLGEYIHHQDFVGVQYEPGTAADIVKAFLQEVAQRRNRMPKTTLHPSALQKAIGYSTKKTVAVFGGIYADIFNRVQDIPKRNEVVLSNAFKMLLGGKATNAAVAMSRLGNEVILLGQVGRDSLGADLDAVLLQENINTDFVTHDDVRTTGTVSLAVDDRAQASVIVNEAANVAVTKVGVDDLFKQVDDGKLHLDCLYLTLETQPAAIDYVVRAAHKRGIFIFCDAAPLTRPLDPELVALIDVIAPNQLEAKAMTGIEVTDPESARKAATKLITEQRAKEVAISLGEQGVYHQSADPEKSVGFVPALAVDAIDETGAGDAFRGAFVTDLLLHHDRKRAMAYGCRAGAFAVTRFGSYDSMPTHEELQFFRP